MTITYILLALTIGISLYTLQNKELLNKLVHHPYSEATGGQYHRLLSSGFLHGSMNHLLINMWVLYQFGGFIEQYFTYRFGGTMGSIIYIAFYLAAIIFANLGTYLKHKENPNFSSLGASGVTSALVLIYCLFDPWQMFIFPPVPAILFAVLYIGYSQWAIRNSSDNIDHQGHLWGSLFGLLFILVVDPSIYGAFLERISNLPF